MRRALNVFVPREENNHHPHLLRHYSLIPLVIAFISLQVNLALFHSSAPKVLSFATSIYQDDFFELINQERTKRGFRSLKESEVLNEAARRKAVDMFEQDYWAHVGPDGTTPWDFFDRVSYNYTYAGENLAKDFNTSAGVVAGWMSSPSHRSNVLNSEFQEMGIAVVDGVLQGEETTLVVQLFGTPYRPAVAGSTETGTNQNAPQYQPAGSSEPRVVNPEEVATAPQAENQPEEEVVLNPRSVFAVASEQEDYKPGGVAVSIRSGFNNLKTKFVLSTQPESWSSGQSLAIFFFLGLTLVLLGDSFVLWRKGIKRHNSHSLMHAAVLTLLAVLTMASGAGAVL